MFLKLIHCPFCGHTVPKSNMYCSYCGRRINRYNNLNGKIIPGIIIAGMCVVLGTGGAIHLVHMHNVNEVNARLNRQANDNQSNSDNNSSNNSDNQSNSDSNSNNSNSDSDWKNNVTNKLPSQPKPSGQYDPGPNPDGTDPSNPNDPNNN